MAHGMANSGDLRPPDDLGRSTLYGGRWDLGLGFNSVTPDRQAGALSHDRCSSRSQAVADEGEIRGGWTGQTPRQPRLSSRRTALLLSATQCIIPPSPSPLVSPGPRSPRTGVGDKLSPRTQGADRRLPRPTRTDQSAIVTYCQSEEPFYISSPPLPPNISRCQLFSFSSTHSSSTPLSSPTTTTFQAHPPLFTSQLSSWVSRKHSATAAQC